MSMMKDQDPNNSVGAITPASNAIAGVTSLVAMLNSVDTGGLANRSIMPLMLFKSREGGIWSFGAAKTIPELGARWAVNPGSFQRGVVAFGEGNKFLDEHLRPVTQNMVDTDKLPDLDWQVQWAVNLKCLDGTDAGVEVVHKINTRGGVAAIVGLFNAIRDRGNSGQHGGKVVPVILLERGSYQHPQYGKTWFPILSIVDWLPLEDTTVPPPSTSPTEDQPRRRRAG